MKETPSQIAHRIGGSKRHELVSECAPFRWEWASVNVPGQSRVRCSMSEFGRYYPEVWKETVAAPFAARDSCTMHARDPSS